ncbi:MAG: DUF6783 domain-containing protein [Ruminococcus sp.]|uniref:DUF6783 domain-containing protein n=1 Tax=Ruminococcus sp. 1001136sp1_2201st1_G3_2201SCRN_220225 TaxID=3141596 RepID=UPI0011DD6AEA
MSNIGENDILTARDFRACLKNHSRNLHAPLCGIFHLNSVALARYGALIRAKSPTNCDEHLAESLFQTRSSRFGTERKWRGFIEIYLPEVKSWNFSMN